MKYVIYISGELGELSMASITEEGIEFCKNNPWDFERPWTIEDLSEEAKEVFTDEPDEWSEGSEGYFCLLYTSQSPRDGNVSRMPSSA